MFMFENAFIVCQSKFGSPKKSTISENQRINGVSPLKAVKGLRGARQLSR